MTQTRQTLCKPLSKVNEKTRLATPFLTAIAVHCGLAKCNWPQLFVLPFLRQNPLLRAVGRHYQLAKSTDLAKSTKKSYKCQEMNPGLKAMSR